MSEKDFKLPAFPTEGADNRARHSSRRDLLEQSKSAHLPFCFIGMRLVCGECSLPLKLYGENFNDSYTDDVANPLQYLCDLHAAERGWIQ